MEFKSLDSDNYERYQIDSLDKEKKVGKGREEQEQPQASSAAPKPPQCLVTANKVTNTTALQSLSKSRASTSQIFRENVLKELQAAVKSRNKKAKSLTKAERQFALHAVSDQHIGGNLFSEALKIYGQFLRNTKRGGILERTADKLSAVENRNSALVTQRTKMNLNFVENLIEGKKFTSEQMEIVKKKHGEPLLNEWVGEVNKLRAGEDLLLPGITPDHATLFRIKKNEDGKFEFTIFNSGLGIEHHKSIIVDGKRKYFTSHTKTNIPANDIKDLLSEIVYTQLDPESDSTKGEMKYYPAIVKFYGFVEYLIGGDMVTPTDPMRARTPQKGGSCTKESIDAYYFDEELQFALAQGGTAKDGWMRYKATQGKLKVEQLGLIIRDLAPRLEKQEVSNEELNRAVHAVSRVNKYWTKHGLKVLGFSDHGIDVRSFLIKNQKAKSLENRMVKVIKPYIQ